MIPSEVAEIAKILQDEFSIDRERAIKIAWRIYDDVFQTSED